MGNEAMAALSEDDRTFIVRALAIHAALNMDSSCGETMHERAEFFLDWIEGFVKRIEPVDQTLVDGYVAKIQAFNAARGEPSALPSSETGAAEHSPSLQFLQPFPNLLEALFDGRDPGFDFFHHRTCLHWS